MLQPVTMTEVEGIRFAVNSADVSGSTLEVHLTASNQGPDRYVRLFVETPNREPSNTRAYDEHGDTLTLTAATLGSTKSRIGSVEALFLSGVPTPITLYFGGLPAAQGHAEIKRLTMLQVDAQLLTPEQQRNPYGSAGSPESAEAMFSNISIGDQPMAAAHQGSTQNAQDERAKHP
jgi:hypothetical protein